MKKVMQMKFMRRNLEKQNAKLDGSKQNITEETKSSDEPKHRDPSIYWSTKVKCSGERSSSESSKESSADQMDLNKFAELASSCRRTFGGDSNKEKKDEEKDKEKEKQPIKMNNRFMARNQSDSEEDDIKRKRLKDHSKTSKNKEGNSGWKRFKRDE